MLNVFITKQMYGEREKAGLPVSFVTPDVYYFIHLLPRLVWMVWWQSGHTAVKKGKLTSKISFIFIAGAKSGKKSMEANECKNASD